MKGTGLLFAIALSTIVLTATAQTDVTDQYVVNADFSDGTFVNNAPSGWTLELSSSGIQSKISTAEKASGIIAGSQNHWQLWQSSGALTGKVYQAIAGLPAGYYKLTAVISPSFGGGSLKLYLNKSTTAVISGNANTYEVEALVADGNIEIGLALNTTDGATIDFDSFKLYQMEASEDDQPTLLETWHAQCVADTLASDRQKWYNRDEMLAAFTAYDEAINDESKTNIAIELLQAAHTHYTEITTAYTSLRTETVALYNETSKSKFCFRDSLRAIYRNILIYYSKNEDNYAWVCEKLPAVREMTSLYGDYKRLNKVISIARNQLKATDYDGQEALQTALSEAWQTLITSQTKEQYEQGITLVKTAQDAYLKNRPSEWITIQNGQLWKTNTGATMQAHAPGFVRVGDIWYMCGEDRGNWWNPDVNLYSSTDLVNWKFEKKIIQNGVTSSVLGNGRMIERAKLMYNEKTDKYIVWCHWESGDYGASEAACFSCDSVNGAYTLEWSGRPLGIKSRDCNIFVDNDGTAYFISTTEENQHLGLFRLSDDYLSAVEHTQLFAWQSREAPAIVRLNNRYFMFSSACSGWDPNQCKLSHSTNLKSGWSGLTNVGNAISYDTQAAAILEIKGTKKTTYLYVGDRWQDPGLPETKTIIFPISFNGTTAHFDYRERFDINFVTGEWRETPVDDYYADKTDWKVVEYSSQESGSGNASFAIDGNLNTMWHTQYSGSVAEAPHSITIDMGSELVIKGFLATPRLDGNTNGLIRKYNFLVSQDGETWTSVSSGDWLPYYTEVDFTKRTCRYIRLVCTEGTYASVAELDVVIDSQATSIEDVRTDNLSESVSIRRYLLDGRPINTPVPGSIYIEQHFDSSGRIITSLKKVAN